MPRPFKWRPKEGGQVVASSAKKAYALAREAGERRLETSALAALARAHLAAKRPEEAASHGDHMVPGFTSLTSLCRVHRHS